MESRLGGEVVRAFVPAPLPPDPAVTMAGGRQRLLERATLAIGRLDSVATVLPDPHLFLYTYVRREAVLSSQIEGTQSSLSDLLLFEMAGAGGAPCGGGDGVGDIGVEVGEEEALEFGDEAGALPGFAWVIDDEFEWGSGWI